MADNEGQIIGHIDDLIAEEHELRRNSVGQGLSPDGRNRLREIEQQLDQCWDLLRQRRARTEFNQDPDDAQARPIPEVESYQQ